MNAAEYKYSRQIFTEFLDGFADEAGIDRKDAEEQWSWWARNMSDNARARIEMVGDINGRIEGGSFKRYYPHVAKLK